MAVSAPTFPAAAATTTAQPFVPPNAALPAANPATTQTPASAAPVRTNAVSAGSGSVTTANGTTGTETGVPVADASVPASPVTSVGNGVATPSDASAVPGTNQPVAATGTTSPSAANGANAAALVQGGVSGVPLAGEPGPVLVMLGVGDGTFRPPIRSWISGDVLAAGDFNGDARMDLVIVQSDNQVLVLQGNGDGTFRAAFPVSMSSAAQSASSSGGAAGGASSGSAAATGGASSSSGAPVTSGASSSGGSANQSTPAASQAPASTSTNPAQGAGTTAGASAAGAGTAGAGTAGAGTAPVSTITPSLSSAGVSFALAADFDGDGRLDLVIGSNPEGTSVFRGLGDFTFDAPVELVTGQSPANGVVADLNGDGKKDVAVANRGSHSISIFLNQGGLVFSASDMPLDRQANDVAAGDVNRDGKPDLVVAATSGGDGETQFTDGFDYVLIGRGNGTFAQPVPYQVPAGAWRLALGDFNGDGAIDIATVNRSAQLNSAVPANGSDSVSILPGNGDGTFGAGIATPLADLTAPVDSRFLVSVRSLTAADVNGDKTPDLVVSGGAILMSRAANTKMATK